MSGYQSALRGFYRFYFLFYLFLQYKLTFNSWYTCGYYYISLKNAFHIVVVPVAFQIISLTKKICISIGNPMGSTHPVVSFPVIVFYYRHCFLKINLIRQVLKSFRLERRATFFWSTRSTYTAGSPE